MRESEAYDVVCIYIYFHVVPVIEFHSDHDTRSYHMYIYNVKAKSNLKLTNLLFCQNHEAKQLFFQLKPLFICYCIICTFFVCHIIYVSIIHLYCKETAIFVSSCSYSFTLCS